MNESKTMNRKTSIFFISILFFIICVPIPAQGLCIGPEECGILGATFLSILTVPLCIIAFLFAIWPKTRRLLQVFAVLPGFMAILTGYLIVLQANRIDLLYIPLLHIGLMALMIGVGRLGSLKESKNIES